MVKQMKIEIFLELQIGNRYPEVLMCYGQGGAILREQGPQLMDVVQRKQGKNADAFPNERFQGGEKLCSLASGYHTAFSRMSSGQADPRI